MSTELRDQLQTTMGDAYRLERELGGGGMSRVFVAEDTALGRKVVVKVISPELAAGVSNDRFRREILLAAQLQHPHIVPVLTAGQTGGLPYFTMPFIEGRSLRARLDGEHGMPIVEAVGILRDVARALAYAHEHGVVHRDIKPDNVLLSGRSAVVTDFGIAKAISSARSEGEGGTLTMVGTSLGTPSYMAPEQVAADPGADHRADIYAYGVMAYEMLTGKTPFHGRTPQALLTAQLTETPAPLSERAPEVPAALAALVMRCLAKNPDERPQNATELLQTLDRLDVSGDWRVPTGPTAARRRPRRAAIAGAALVAVLLLIGFMVARRLTTPDRTIAADVVAVVPFRVASADPSLHYLREGMLDLLAGKLTGEGSLRATEPRSVLAAWHGAGGSATNDLSQEQALGVAREVGAGRLLLGDVVGTRIRVVLSAALLRVPDGNQLARVSVEGAPDSLPWLVDRMAVNLLTQVSGETERSATLLSTSLPALRAYLDGQAKLRRGNARGAVQDFERALTEDSTFAVAALYEHQALGWFNDGGSRQRALEIAWRERAKLGPRDLALLTAVAGPRYPQRSSTTELLRAREQYVSMAGDRPDAWYLLGDTYFHYGPALGVPDYPDRAFEAFRRAWEMDTTYVVPILHGLYLTALLNDTVTARRFEQTLLRSDSSPGWQAIHRYNQAFRGGDTSRARAIIDSLNGSVGYQFTLLQQTMYDGIDAPTAWRELQSMYAQAPTPRVRRAWERQAHDVAIALGKAREATRLLQASIDTTPDPNALIIAIRDDVVGEGDSAAGEQAARELTRLEGQLQLPDSVRPAWRRSIVRVMETWRLSRGDTSQTRRSIAELRALARTDSSGYDVDKETEIAVIEAMHAEIAQSDARRAIAERLDSLMRVTDYTSVHQARTPLASMVLARMFERLGDSRRALAAVRRRPDAWAGALPYLAAQLREEGRIAALAGEREQAIAAYRQYLALRFDPEPSKRTEVDAVRRELEKLLERRG
jgi:serine/threonine-protein kinase